MRAAFERDDACLVDHLVQDDDVARRLQDAVARPVSGREDAARHAARDAPLPRRVVHVGVGQVDQVVVAARAGVVANRDPPVGRVDDHRPAPRVAGRAARPVGEAAHFALRLRLGGRHPRRLVRAREPTRKRGQPLEVRLVGRLERGRVEVGPDALDVRLTVRGQRRRPGLIRLGSDRAGSQRQREPEGCSDERSGRCRQAHGIRLSSAHDGPGHSGVQGLRAGRRGT